MPQVLAKEITAGNFGLIMVKTKHNFLKKECRHEVGTILYQLGLKNGQAMPAETHKMDSMCDSHSKIYRIGRFYQLKVVV